MRPKTGKEESTAEAGDPGRSRRQTTACTSPSRTCPLMFRRLFVMPASVKGNPQFSPIYVKNI